MRILKFKAWDTKDPSHHDPNSSFTLQKAIGSRLHDGVDTDGVIYRQFTGFHDRTGKEIYEGDIVKCDASYQTPTRVNKEAMPITFEQGMFTALDIPLRSFSQGKQSIGCFEVIGDVYANPELLAA